jgi:hypothetical protein
VEYLLHVQELLADHKAELLQAGATMQKKSEKIDHVSCGKGIPYYKLAMILNKPRRCSKFSLSDCYADCGVALF